MSKQIGVGILGLGSYFPPAERGNEYWDGKLRARVVGFDSFDALETSTERLDGSIAFVNQTMPPYDAATHDPGYRIALPARLHSASQAARRSIWFRLCDPGHSQSVRIDR